MNQLPPNPGPVILEKRVRIRLQLEQAHAGSKIECDCGAVYPIWLVYRCLYCGEFYCGQCAEMHFGQTRKEWAASKA